MKQIRATIAMLMCSCLFGCFGYMQDDGSFTVTLGTTLSLAQTGPKDPNEESRIGVDLPDWMQKPFIEYFIDSDGDGVADMTGDGNNPPK